MKIRKISIQRFKSLKKVSLEDIGDLIILIGANGSGKSNLLEALTLFFNELNFDTTEKSIGNLDKYFWFGRNDRQSIEFEIVIELNKDEIKDMLPEGSKETYRVGDEGRLTIKRAIRGPANSATWGIASAELITFTKGKLVITGKVAPPTEGKPDEASEKEGKQKATKATLQTDSTDLLDVISPNLLQRLKSRFIYIPSARNATATFTGYQRRPSIIINEILESLKSLWQNIAKDEEMITLQDNVRSVSGTIQEIRPYGSELTIREQGTNRLLPLALIGSGHQELIALEYRLLTETECFFGIEEPDLHLHPELLREFLAFLKNICRDKQVFIATHSTAFVDATDLKNVWIARKQNGESSFQTIRESEDLKILLYELGCKPSDLFFPNGIIFVEGPSDKMAYSILSERLKFDFPQKAISFIPIRGKSKGKYHLQVWTEAVKNTNLPFFMILDKVAEEEAKELIQKHDLKPDINFFTLSKGDLEEYYPPKKLIDALASFYDLKFEAEERKEIVKSPRCKNIEELLDSKLHYKLKGEWKTPVAKAVANSMNVEEIDSEVRTILERINSGLSLR
jgi:predicted ATP-dependent endonuclease of OLD family